MKRRAFLQLLAGGTALTAVSTAEAVHTEEGQPPHVTLSFDQGLLETYQPKLVTRTLDVKPSQQYAWIATSPEHETDVYCYWTWYVSQRGLTGQDSHYLDREPVYVFVDSTTGDVQRVLYSAYHWLKGSTSDPTLTDEQNPTLRVVERWHHYLLTDEVTGVYVPLSDLDTTFEAWLDNGWEEDLYVGAAQDPWVMLDRGSWWNETAVGFSFNEMLRRSYVRASNLTGFDIFGAGTTDL